MGKQEPGRGPSADSKRKELEAIRQARNCLKTVPLKVKRIAIENQQPLLTRNKKDFSGIITTTRLTGTPPIGYPWRKFRSEIRRTTVGNRTILRISPL